MADRPDWAFGQFTPEAIEAKRNYYMSLRTEEDGVRMEKRLLREEDRLQRRRPNPNAKHERNVAIWKERKEEGATFQALADKHGLTRERIRQIIAKEDRMIARRAYLNELRNQREGASYGG
jgi:hypothetical protein